MALRSFLDAGILACAVSDNDPRPFALWHDPKSVVHRHPFATKKRTFVRL